MTEDILEQVVDDWLRRQRYFTRTNVRFGPVKGHPDFVSRDHNQQSDLDVLAVAPRLPRDDPRRVLAVSCKAMQVGFSPNRWLAAAKQDKVYNGKRAQKHLRELWDPIWARALKERVHELCGEGPFTYVLAVTRVGSGGTTDTACWHEDPVVSGNLHGPTEVLTFGRMWSELKDEVSNQIEPSHIGRLAQFLRAIERDGT